MNNLFALLLAVVTTFAQAQALQPPEMAARQYLLMDLTTNQVLAERDADVATDPASLTKLMTAYIVFGALRDKKLTLEQPIAVSVRAWEERKGDPSLMFIDTTMRPTVDELLHGMIVVSGNDASVALAEAVGGGLDAFVGMMNRQAQAWGLKNTVYKNVTGTTETGHKSSARDIAVVASRIVRDFPQYYRYYSIKEYTYNKIRQDNRNLLLRRDATVDGMKTGYTDAAGYCLVASAAQQQATSGGWCRWCSAPRRAMRAPMKARSCSTGASPRLIRCACSKPASRSSRRRSGRACRSRPSSAPKARWSLRCRAARATS
jgi:serine-type D-Ala-D-Ala carboxypeptidase (penicillin-binding protein 5/6)